nr:hypothetical protein [Tanacetum cinerariifolium]
LQAPPSPDYIPGPEEPEQAPPSPDYVLGPEHADDEIIAEDQPYVEDASPIALSPEYVPGSDFEAHPEDDDDEDPKEDPDDEDEEDDEMDVEANEEVEDEHPAPADSVVVAPTATDQAPSTEEMEPFETDESAATPPPHPAYRTTARISILAPLPSASRREDRLEVTLPPRKRLDIALGPRYKIEESSSAAAARPAGGFRADYSFVATGAPVSIDTELGGYVREFEMRVRQDTDEIYMRLDDEQTERQLLADASDLVHGEVMSLRTTMLGQMSEIRELQAADRRRQTVISELLRIDHRRSTEILELRTTLHGQVTALQGQVTTLQAQVTTLQGQHGHVGGHTQSKLPEEAGGSA